MNLKEEILNNLEPISGKERQDISVFLKDMFSIDPSRAILLEIRNIKSVRCYENGAAFMVIPSRKVESVKHWLDAQGFTIRKRNDSAGAFCGYNLFLLEEYAL